MTDDRRGSTRIPIHLAGELETAHHTSSIAISRDVAAGGLLVYTRVPVAVGEKIKLTVLHDGVQMHLHGTVLRVADVDLETSTLWTHEVAIGVDPHDPVLATLYGVLKIEPPES